MDAVQPLDMDEFEGCLMVQFTANCLHQREPLQVSGLQPVNRLKLMSGRELAEYITAELRSDGLESKAANVVIHSIRQMDFDEIEEFVLD